MQYRVLGKSGISVSALCLGSMNFGVPTEEAHAVRITHRAIDAGVNFIDCANTYGGKGGAETIVGKALAGRRDAVVLTTKFRDGKSLAQFALAWTLANRAVSSVIIGPRTIEQLEDNLGAVGWSPSAEDERQVDALVPRGEHTGKGYNDPQYPVRGRVLA